MLVRIEGSSLPGRQCGPSPEVPSGYRNVHVGVQRRGRLDELLGLCLGMRRLRCGKWRSRPLLSEGGWDLRGPYVQGRPGGRFLYLSWGTVDAEGRFTMFRRAKLLFSTIDAEVLAAAVSGGVLVGRLGLTDPRGNPLCAPVQPPLIEWSAS